MRPRFFLPAKSGILTTKTDKEISKKVRKNNMRHNVIRNGDTLTVDIFMDLNKYFNSVVTMSSLDNMHNDGGIHKLIIKNSKCNLTIDAVRCLLTNPILDNLKEIDIIRRRKVLFC